MFQATLGYKVKSCLKTTEKGLGAGLAGKVFAVQTGRPVFVFPEAI